MPIEVISSDSYTIVVDIITDFDLELTAEQAKQAREDGSTGSDQKIKNPPTIVFECAQTQTPIDDPDFDMTEIDLKIPKVQTTVISPFLLAGGAIEAGIGAIVGAFKKKDEVMKTYQTSNPRDRVGDLADQLGELWASDELATITYKGRSISNMSLLGVKKSDRVSEAGLGRFFLTFEAVDIKKVSRVALPNPSDLAQKATQSLGKKAGAEGPNANGVSGSQATSILSKLTGG